MSPSLVSLTRLQPPFELVETAVVVVSRDHLCYRLRVRPAVNAECLVTPSVDYELSVVPAVKAEMSVQPAIAYRLVVRPALNGTLRINPC